ncbi:MAG: PadR family transcriptional regulator [Candidatus Micrarchaeota archaeon]
MADEPSPMMRLKRTTEAGNLWLYVLSLVSKNKVYAYGLRDEINKKFGWRPGLITSYIVLYKLESEGLIASEFEGRRKYYTITQKGKDTLSEAKEYLKKLASKL